MAAITKRDDSYDIGLFAGVVQGDTTHLLCFAGAGAVYYYKKPADFGDATVYNVTLSVGVPLPIIIPTYSVMYIDLACTTVIPVGKVICTHVGARTI